MTRRPVHSIDPARFQSRVSDLIKDHARILFNATVNPEWLSGLGALVLYAQRRQHGADSALRLFDASVCIVGIATDTRSRFYLSLTPTQSADIVRVIESASIRAGRAIDAYRLGTYLGWTDRVMKRFLKWHGGCTTMDRTTALDWIERWS